MSYWHMREDDPLCNVCYAFEQIGLCIQYNLDEEGAFFFFMDW